MSRNWQNDRYAQTMTKPSIRLPRSTCVCDGITGAGSLTVATFDSIIGPSGLSFSDSSSSTATLNVTADRTWPMPKTAMKIVEYQCGSSDITQSIDAKVTVSAYSPMPAALRRVVHSAMTGLLAVSCFFAQ